MREFDGFPTIVDFAYEIIAMNEENISLRRGLEHYKLMHEDNMKSMKQSQDATMKNIGTIIGAVLDPDSAINKGSAALMREQIQEES